MGSLTAMAQHRRPQQAWNVILVLSQQTLKQSLLKTNTKLIDSEFLCLLISGCHVDRRGSRTGRDRDPIHTYLSGLESYVYRPIKITGGGPPQNRAVRYGRLAGKPWHVTLLNTCSLDSMGSNWLIMCQKYELILTYFVPVVRNFLICLLPFYQSWQNEAFCWKLTCRFHHQFWLIWIQIEVLLDICDSPIICLCNTINTVSSFNLHHWLKFDQTDRVDLSIKVHFQLAAVIHSAAANSSTKDSWTKAMARKIAKFREFRFCGEQPVWMFREQSYLHIKHFEGYLPIIWEKKKTSLLHIFPLRTPSVCLFVHVPRIRGTNTPPAVQPRFTEKGNTYFLTAWLTGLLTMKYNTDKSDEYTNALSLRWAVQSEDSLPSFVFRFVWLEGNRIETWTMTGWRIS